MGGDLCRAREGGQLEGEGQKYFCQKYLLKKYFLEIFLKNIFCENILDENIFYKNIFGPPLLTAHSPLPNIQPPPLLSQLLISDF